jgi:hypothetical protein
MPMLDQSVLDASLVRLWSMYQASCCTRRSAVCTVVDYYHFNVHNIGTVEGNNMMVESLYNALRVHKDKKYLLVPYKKQ